MTTDSDPGVDFPMGVKIEAIDAEFWLMTAFFFKAIAAFLVTSIPYVILAAIVVAACMVP